MSHSCCYLKTGFSAFPQSSNFMAKQILPHATQNLQVINTGMYSCTYIYVCILKIQKLWAILIDIWKTNTEKFLSLTQNLCLHCITNLALKTLSIMNAFSCLKTSLNIKCSLGISRLTILLNKSIHGVGQLNWAWH